MIRQLCPHCYSAVELPDDAVGHDAPCPKCGQTIAVPTAYAPSVSATGGLPGLAAPTPPAPPLPAPGTYPMIEPPAPPPGLNAASIAPPPTPTAPAPVSESAARSWGVTISPAWLDWVPVACFTIILLLALFNWVGTYPGGTRVYSQGPWYALVGEISTNTLPEDLLQDEKYLEEKVTSNRWLILYFPLLFAALLLGWLDRIVRNPTVNSMPALAWLPSIWPRRFLVLTVLSALLLVVLLIQTWRGFGLETAVKQKVAEPYAKQIDDADSTPKKQRLTVTMGGELARYQLQGTTPLNAALALHAVALLAMLGRWWLHNREGRPYPRLSLQY